MPDRITAFPKDMLTPQQRTEMRRIDQPCPGFFRTRLVRGGPWVGAIIYQPCPFAAMPVVDGCGEDDWFVPLDRSRPLSALIDGLDVGALTLMGGEPRVLDLMLS